MVRRIKIIISKEDIYDVRDLINEIRKDPKEAYSLCKAHGLEEFSYDVFADFDSLTEEDQEMVLEDYASAKSNLDAALSEEQDEKFDLFVELFEEEG